MGFLDEIKEGCIRGWQKNKILPSLTGAQAVIESGWGKSKLSLPPYNALFGIKASSDWKGRTVNMPTQEYGRNGPYWINADFRAYDSWSDSIVDHTNFFTDTEWRKNNYREVIGETDYKKACRAIQAAGYATGPSYAASLISVIERNNLQAWDTEAFNRSAGGESNQTTLTDGLAIKEKRVGGDFTEETLNFIRSSKATVIGDSLGVGTDSYLKRVFKKYYADVIGSRQWTHSNSQLNAISVLQTIVSNDNLHDYVVFILGTNAGANEADVVRAIEMCGSRKIILVDTASEVSHRVAVANLYYELSKKYSNVFWANWSEFAKNNMSEWYSPDGANGARIHMTPKGYQKHAEFIMRAIFECSKGNWEITSKSAANSAYIGIEDIEYNENGLYSPKGQSVIYNHDANEKYGLRSGDKIIWIDSLFNRSEISDTKQLLSEAVKYMDQHREPGAQYTVPLTEIPRDVSIGNTGTFTDYEFSIDKPLTIQARILSINTSDTVPSNNTVVIGNVKEVFPLANPDVERLKADLIKTREQILEDYRNGAEINLTINSTAGLDLTDIERQTTLYITADQNGFDVSDALLYSWERVSKDTTSDKVFNYKLKDNNSAALTIYYEDVINDEINIFVRAYTSQNVRVGMVGANIKISRIAKSAYQIWLDAGNRGTELQFLESLKGDKGDPGANGIPGPKGENGRTQYTHIAYANGTQGENFSTSDSSGREYMGTYVDFIQADSTDHTKYRWLKVKGERGERGLQGLQGPQGNQGIQGAKGADGQSSYTHIAYANNITGTSGFSLSDSNREYIGVYVDNNPTSSSTPSKYKWTLVKGRDGSNGLPGAKGADGRTPYFHTAYANSADGTTGFSTTVSDKKRYIGHYTDYTQADSIDPSKYKWVDMVGSVNVGGRNLLINSNLNKSRHTYTKDTTKELVGNGTYYLDYIVDFKPNTEYTLSVGDFEINGKEGLRVVIYDSEVSQWKWNIYRDYEFKPNSSVTFTTPSTVVSGDKLLIYPTDGTRINYVIKELKLEEGNIRTPYSPAIEDLYEKIEYVDSKITNPNLLENSSFSENLNMWNKTGNFEKVTKNGFPCHKISGALKTTYHLGQSMKEHVVADDVSQLYIFSADVLAENITRGTTNPYLEFNIDGSYFEGNTSKWFGASKHLVESFDNYNDGQWHRVAILASFNKPRDVINKLSCYIYVRDFTGDLYFKNIKMERVNERKLEAQTPWVESTKDIHNKIDSKADSQETSEYLLAMQGEIQKARQESEAKASMEEVSALIEAVRALREATNKDIIAQSTTLANALKKLASVENELGDMAERWKFNDTIMQMSEEGFLIGNRAKGTYLLQSDDRIGLFNNGVEVAFISGGMLQITQAVFVERIQIGEYMIGSYENNTKILALRHVGGIN